MLPLLDYSLEQLQAWLAERGLPRYRAAQIRHWMLERTVDRFEAMSDLPKALRTQLAESFSLWTTQVVTRRTSDDQTEKLLLGLADGQRVECVLLRDDRQHRTVCLSTQVGCAMGCVFCASGLDGVVRNLTSGEILEEMLQLKRLLPEGERISHIVVMGMGEPLANLDRLLPALAVASNPEGLGISQRRITISTVGLPPAIRRLADEDCQYHLAISLHAPDDALRNQLVPANRKTGIGPILEAADYYFDVTGRRVTYEYVLLGELNDQPEHARRLVTLLQGRPALVNLIPYNPVPELPYRTPAAETVAHFVETLERGGLTVKIRYRKGNRIDAACGQLRRSISEIGKP